MYPNMCDRSLPNRREIFLSQRQTRKTFSPTRPLYVIGRQVPLAYRPPRMDTGEHFRRLLVISLGRLSQRLRGRAHVERVGVLAGLGGLDAMVAAGARPVLGLA
jgi:hypothetical protein